MYWGQAAMTDFKANTTEPVLMNFPKTPENIRDRRKVSRGKMFFPTLFIILSLKSNLDVPTLGTGEAK